jgi:site-specific DNA recombinase
MKCSPNPQASGLKPQAPTRCAIYTRKSTEEGLEQEFNSLDAQRESGEAYIASQRSEGWIALPDRYDDGGFTGGNMERPALKRLMADIEAGKVDCIVVYKVDRLSRSLLDFARMMETFDRCRVSFVSVTQQFNTTNSMGRLTLNILLSFAQFEREIISERTRDKIAAARRKGRWSGGRPVLGYDVAPGGGRLLVNEDEATRVRGIFELYLEHQSLLETVKVLDERGWTNKRWTTQDGRDAGGSRFDKPNLFNLLTNVLYLGKITLKKEMFDGQHPAIVDAEIFRRVQALLRRNGQSGGRHVRNRFGALLKGILRCVPCDSAMIHTHTLKNGNKRYRYYVCLNAQKRGWHNCPSKVSVSRAPSSACSRVR